MGVKGLIVHFICPNNWVIFVREYIFDHFLLKFLYLVCHFCKWVLYHLLANDEQTSQNYSITVKEEKINTTLTNLTLWKKIPVKQLKLNCELISQWPEKNIFWIPLHHNINIYILFTPLHTFHLVLTRRIFQQSKLLATTIHLLWKGVWTPDSYTVYLTCMIPATGMIYREPSTHAQTNHEPDGSRVIILMALAGFWWDLIKNTVV